MRKLAHRAKQLVKKGDLFLKKHGQGQFHLEAAELLHASALSDLYDYRELVISCMRGRLDPLQNFKSFEFSDLPVTLARGEGCFLDFYFWRRRPTVIHNHHFTGAFQCLQGANVDLVYDFRRKQRLGKFHAWGELQLVNSRELKKGDTVGIAFQDKFIHENHHQAELTINACFRTPEVPGKRIANFLYSGLRFEKDPTLLMRTERLLRFCSLGDFDHEENDLSLDDAIHFLIKTHGTSSLNPRLLKLRKGLGLKVREETGMDVSKLIHAHEVESDRLLELYE